jgi:Na+-translocating ferredoxin:NAD+ oxidoreductase RnfC subunit
VLLGGVMMGRLAGSLDEPVTKTLGGVVVLPVSHPMIAWYRQGRRQVERIGRSACDQCRFCTELCPRYLLGHPIEPHAAMRSLGFESPHSPMIAGTLYCCECNLCSLYSCRNLDPKNVCVNQAAGARAPVAVDESADIQPHPRRVPARADETADRQTRLAGFTNVGPLERAGSSGGGPAAQAACGAPAIPVVTVGRVSEAILSPPRHPRRWRGCTPASPAPCDRSTTIVIEA